MRTPPQGSSHRRCWSFLLAAALWPLASPAGAATETFDLVLLNGRVIDPESKLDAVRHVGIRAGVVRALSTSPLDGRVKVDVKGQVIAPGFIDLHQHSQAPGDYALKAQDGVTTVAELEVGTADVDAWYAARTGRTPIHYAVSIGHIPCRMLVMGDRPDFLPGAKSGAAVRRATDAQLGELRRAMERGLQRGAVAVGFGLQYTPGASEWETVEIFRLAAQYQAPCHLHMRAKGDAGPQNVYGAVLELIAASTLTGAPAHICHVQSTANKFTPRVLQLVSEARARGVDLTVECYPYTAGMTDIKSAIFDPGWQERAGTTFSDIQWPATGERLTEESFARYRQQGGLVIIHSNPEEVIRETVSHPLTMIASDGLRGHPRHAGTSARILGRYVREAKVITLMQAIDKLSLMPARRLETRVPAMKNKGRIRVGADADLVVFNPDTVIDRATYEKPDLSSSGIAHVLVAGTFVVRDGELQRDTFAGQPVRAPVR
ncbi:MAG: amidohydrolase family protein [Opitutaceae bacterium]|nr:amidohydrolase family protein [Opitutaceae bacterium]